MMRLKFKLLLLAVVPLLFLILFSLRTGLDNLREVREMNDLEELVKVASEVGALVHELQKERGMSAGFIGSKGANFANELPKQRAEVDGRHTNLEHHLATFDPASLGDGLQRQLGEARQRLQELANIRQSVSTLAISGPETIAYYSKTIGSLLAIVAQTSSVSGVPEISRAATAYDALLRGKEFAGIERATLSNVFGANRFVPEMLVRYLSVSSAQDVSLATFQRYANPAQAAYLAEKLSGPAVDEVARIKKLAIERMHAESLDLDAKVWFGKATERINLLKAVEDRLANDLVEMADKGRTQARLTMFAYLGLTLLAIALTGTIGYPLIRQILRQIGGEPGEAVNVARRIAEGQLAEEVTVAQADEKSLMAAMKTMHDKLSHVLIRIEESGQQMEQSAFQVASVSRSIGEAVRQEESRSTEVATITRGVTEIAREVRTQAEVAADKTRSVEQRAKAGVAAVEKNIAELSGAASEVARAENEVDDLTAAAAKITHIIETIRQIADQTNLLALNAAIEAARAGEQGRGFAVVADEVRKLAERTHASSIEVSDIVGAITSRVSHLHKVMESVVARVRAGQTVASETAQVMTHMAEGVSEAARGSDTIAGESRLQMQQIESLDRALQRLFAALTENATKVEATAIIGTDLHEISRALNELMAGFTFKRDPHIPRAPAAEKRRHPRLERGLLATVTTEDGNTHECLTEDLSVSGARLQLSRPLPRTGRVRLTMRLPQSNLERYHDQEPISLQGEVKWQNTDGEQPVCGIAFTNLSASDLAYLKTVFAFYNKSPEHHVTNV